MKSPEQEAIDYMMNFYDVDEETVRDIYWDEVQSFVRLVNFRDGKMHPTERIIYWAQEAGASNLGMDLNRPSYFKMFEHFAKLVAEYERDQCIDIVAMNGGSVEIEAHIRQLGENDE